MIPNKKDVGLESLVKIKDYGSTLNVLRDPRGDTAPFAKAFPNLHAPGTDLAAQQKVELVDVYKRQGYQVSHAPGYKKFVALIKAIGPG